MLKTRKLALVCLLLFLLAIVVIAFHHHDDGCSHDDCPVCVAAFIISTASFSTFIFVVFVRGVALETSAVYEGYNYVYHDFRDARAPPV
jgi:hypothetical protein